MGPARPSVQTSFSGRLFPGRGHAKPPPGRLTISWSAPPAERILPNSPRSSPAWEGWGEVSPAKPLRLKMRKGQFPLGQGSKRPGKPEQNVARASQRVGCMGERRNTHGLTHIQGCTAAAHTCVPTAMDLMAPGLAELVGLGRPD